MSREEKEAGWRKRKTRGRKQEDQKEQKRTVDYRKQRKRMPRNLNALFFMYVTRFSKVRKVLAAVSLQFWPHFIMIR